MRQALAAREPELSDARPREDDAAAAVPGGAARPAAFLSRTDLRELGLERRAVDAIFRAFPVIALPGYSRPLIRVDDYRALIEASTYRDDRVRVTS